METRATRGHYLRRSAETIRESVKPALDKGQNLIDRHIRIVYTGQGPEFWNAETVFGYGAQLLVLPVAIRLRHVQHS
jgi:hypothetical protein